MIRQFQPGDAKACSNLVRACIRADTSASQKLRDELVKAESPEAMQERARLFYVAVYESAGGVVGLGGLDLNEIRFLHVAPEHQRRGIGRSLLAHLGSMVPSALFSDLFVYSTATAMSFYQAHGFQPGGQHRFDIEGELLVTVFMTKST